MNQHTSSGQFVILEMPICELKFVGGNSREKGEKKREMEGKGMKTVWKMLSLFL